MRQIGVRPEQCVYDGDDERDMVAGRAAGMATVAARYGYLGAGAVVYFRRFQGYSRVQPDC